MDWRIKGNKIIIQVSLDGMSRTGNSIVWLTTEVDTQSSVQLLPCHVWPLWMLRYKLVEKVVKHISTRRPIQICFNTVVNSSITNSIVSFMHHQQTKLHSSATRTVLNRRMQISEWADYTYNVFRKKHPLTFSIITPTFLGRFFILFVPMETGMNTVQHIYLTAWWRHNCITSNVTKVYFIE